MYQNEEHKRGVIERGDGYEYIGSYYWNEVTIDGKNKKQTKSYIRVKCPYCSKEYDIDVYSFVKGNKSKCNYCCNFYEKSFAHHIQQELQESLNKYWDWEKNTVNPYLINKNYKKKVVIKCDKKDYHNDFGGYEVKPIDFIKGVRCPYCHNFKVHPKDSFAQWGIDTFGEDFLKRYWSPKNTINPWEIKPGSDKKVWLLCQEKDYHNDKGGYLICCEHFHSGVRCTYCGKNGKLHKLDSFAYLYPEKAKYWSPNNDKSPYEVAPKSKEKYKFICEKCGEEFERGLTVLNKSDLGVVCNNCNSSVLEKNTAKILNKYNIKYYKEYIFNDLIGVGNNNLRFDFYLPDYKLLIECQGIQHKIWQRTWMSKKEFKIILEHDKRKEEYCKRNNIELIKIWYYDIDNIEEILTHRLNLNKNN
ncbi:MAG: zinc-ribbon domain-containing protein [Clostridia bacterium]